MGTNDVKLFAPSLAVRIEDLGAEGWKVSELSSSWKEASGARALAGPGGQQNPPHRYSAVRVGDGPQPLLLWKPENWRARYSDPTITEQDKIHSHSTFRNSYM